jgi:hypothetical protein
MDDPTNNERGPRLTVTITPRWEDMTELVKYTAAKHQTLFALGSDGKVMLGQPLESNEPLRLCASITSYMKPRFEIHIEEDGKPATRAYYTRTTVVNASTKMLDEGSCDHCRNVPPDKRPIVYQWRSGKNTLFSEIIGQTGEDGKQILDIKIGCLSGTGLSRQHKGHKHDFMLKTELIGFEGVCGYSMPIQMGSKYIDCTQKHISAKRKEQRMAKKSTKVTQSPDSSPTMPSNKKTPAVVTAEAYPMYPEVPQNPLPSLYAMSQTLQSPLSFPRPEPGFYEMRRIVPTANYQPFTVMGPPQPITLPPIRTALEGDLRPLYHNMTPYNYVSQPDQGRNGSLLDLAETMVAVSSMPKRQREESHEQHGKKIKYDYTTPDYSRFTFSSNQTESNSQKHFVMKVDSYANTNCMSANVTAHQSEELSSAHILSRILNS